MMRINLAVVVTFIALLLPYRLFANDMIFSTTKICQLTGEEDRQPPRNPTGSLLGGETGGVTGTDLGFPFEYKHKMYFLFGDSREFPPDRCEPAWCGTENNPKDVWQPKPELVRRWRSDVEWKAWERIRTEGSDSMATAPLNFDPEHCIPLKFEAVGKDGIFAHEVNSNVIGVPFQLGGPPVAANPQDKWVLVNGNRILVITEDGRVFAHEVNGNTIGVPFQLVGPLVAANPQDKWLLAMNNRLLVITKEGKVFAHEVNGNTIGAPFQIEGPPVAANPQDKWLLAMNNRLLIITKEGKVFAHEVNGNTIGAPFQIEGPPVAANPQDKWLLTINNRLWVITKEGRVFVHNVNSNTVDDAIPISGPLVAANWEDVRVLGMGSKFLVATVRRFRPTQLNNKVVGRDEGAIGGFSYKEKIYSFFTLRDKPLGCLASVPGCPHGGAEPGGKSVLSISTNSDSSFRELLLFSKTKFLWTVPEVAKVGSVPGLPSFMTDSVVLVWGSGRVKNALDPKVDGLVYVHELSSNKIGVPFQLGGPIVAANVQDKWLLAIDNRLLVITEDGRVFAHEVNGNVIGVPFQLGGALVAANPQDKWVLVNGNRILVVTKDGRVFAHEVNGNVVGAPFQLGGATVATNPQDKWLLAMNNRLLVITKIPVSRWNHSYPYLAVAPLSQVGLKNSWRYFAGLKENGQPDWQGSEDRAQPIFPSNPLQDGNGYHQCLGYFSVRYIAGWHKWGMMYTCNNDAMDGYNIDNGPRGIYLRTAAHPWGPWSTPQRIFDPDQAYCYFMHDQRGDESNFCYGKGVNPAEESVRDTSTRVTKRAWGGEYAPIMLPTQYAKVSNDRTILYFLMATWNPYQVMLMKTEVSPNP